MAGPAPAPTPAPATPGGRISPARSTVDAGRSVKVSVRALRNGTAAAGAPVRLQLLNGTTWRTIRSGTSDAQGLVSWTVTPDRTRSLRAVVDGVPVASAVVQVRQRVTARVSWTRTGAVVTGTSGPAGRSTVVLERRTSTGWNRVTRAVAGADGRYRLAAPLPRGTVVRVVIAARPTLLAGSTSAVRLG